MCIYLVNAPSTFCDALALADPNAQLQITTDSTNFFPAKQVAPSSFFFSKAKLPKSNNNRNKRLAFCWAYKKTRKYVFGGEKGRQEGWEFCNSVLYVLTFPLSI